MKNYVSYFSLARSIFIQFTSCVHTKHELPALAVTLFSNKIYRHRSKSTHVLASSDGREQPVNEVKGKPTRHHLDDWIKYTLRRTRPLYDVCYNGLGTTMTARSRWLGDPCSFNTVRTVRERIRKINGLFMELFFFNRVAWCFFHTG